MGSALSRALSLLARRGYSEAELRKKLAGYPEAEVEAAIARLRDWGYLDDRAYAEAFVRARKARWGPAKLRFALRQRGVDEAVIDEFVDEEDALLRAVALLARRWARLGGDRAKAVRFLQSRGFSLEVALAAYRRLREDPPLV